MPLRIPQIDQAHALLYHARAATPFFSEEGEPLASVPIGIAARRVVALRSAAFRDWLIANFYGEYEAAPSSTALRAALRTLEARARFGDMPSQKVRTRLSFEGDSYTPSKVVLDLANPDGEVVEITSQGFTIANNLHHAFRQSHTAVPLPRPLHSDPRTASALAEFAALLNLTETARVRTLLWLAAALKPTGPYPILVIQGPSGSGKSFFAQALRAIVDPSSTPLQQLPERPRELREISFHNWILAFEDVNRIPAKIAAALSAISSGDLSETAHPVILIAASGDQRHWIPSHSLARRTLTVDLQALATPRPEAELWRAFESLHPALTTAICHTVATALARVRDIDLGNVPRFADAAAWTAAAAPALGISERAIIAQFTTSDSMWTGSDPVRDAMRGLLQRTNPWHGDASSLLRQLQTIRPGAVLPSTPKGLSQALAKILDIAVSKSRDAKGGRLLTITSTPGASYNSAAHDRSSH